MSEDEIIRAVERIETDFDEKIVLDSPFEAKEFINALPWQKLEDEEKDHGSLTAKLENREVADAAIDAAAQFDFSDDFSAHPTWEPEELNGRGAWLVDADTFEETAEFFQFAGYDVEIDDSVEI